MNDSFLSELNIEMLIRIKENSWNSRNYINLNELLTTDIEVINYRLDALGDLLDNREFYNAVKELQSYIRLTDYLHELFGKYTLKSELFLGLKSDIDEIYISKEYKRIKECVPDNLDLISGMQSVTIGVNIDSSMRPVEAGLVSVNTEKFVSGSILDKLMRADLSESPYQCSAPLAVPGRMLSKEEREHFEGVFNSALFKVLSTSLKSWKAAVKAYTSAKMGSLMRYESISKFV